MGFGEAAGAQGLGMDHRIPFPGCHMPCSSEDDAMARATSSADGEEMYEDKVGFGIARRTERSLQMKKGLMRKQGEISDEKQFRGDL